MVCFSSKSLLDRSIALTRVISEEKAMIDESGDLGFLRFSAKPPVQVAWIVEAPRPRRVVLIHRPIHDVLPILYEEILKILISKDMDLQMPCRGDMPLWIPETRCR